MRIGYACLAVAVPGSALKSCNLKNASDERLLSLISHNLNALQTMIGYNARNDIALYRISSELIPFGSSAAAQLDWATTFSDPLATIGQAIRRAGMRVSMHPGQYTHLSSPDPDIAARAEADLRYHAQVLDALDVGTEGKIILHLGGAYGNKRTATERFLKRFQNLDAAVKRRLVLENDDTIYNIADVLDVASAADIPVVFDSLHNSVNPADAHIPAHQWIKRCATTWHTPDGPQKIHYSQQNIARRPGAHAETIAVDAFLEWIAQLPERDADVMLEVKDKNLSALKCINCVTNRGIATLEAEWAHYKYLVLEKSPDTYRAIRLLLRDKSAYPAPEMYRMIEEALRLPTETGNAINAAQHVWGYFNQDVTEAEKRRFQTVLAKYASGKGQLQSVKRMLWRLCEKYENMYLLESYYFNVGQ